MIGVFVYNAQINNSIISCSNAYIYTTDMLYCVILFIIRYNI